jgi:CrcB protein
MIMTKLLLVLFGGGLGAVSRYGSTLLAVRLFGAGFPWGTLFANLVGCLLIGILTGLSEAKGLLSVEARLFLITGFLGGLTTFSTYALETVNFARDGSFVVTLIQLTAHNLAGLALVLIGIELVRAIA